MALVVSAVVAGCHEGREPAVPGSAQAVVTLSHALSEGDVARVELTVRGAGMTTRTDALVKTGQQWAGVLGLLPEGEGRTFRGEAFDGDGILRYAGEVTDVVIVGGQTTAVALVLQQVGAPAPFENAAPFITSLVASPSSVGPGGEVSLHATVEDPDVEDRLTVAWTASAGGFSSASSLTPVWTAPAEPGAVVLTLTVSDTKGATSALSVTILVSPATGSAAVNVSVNTWPQVTGMTASPGSVEVGATTAVAAVVTDNDGDTLAYQWTSDCEGTWEHATSAQANFTPTAPPPASGTCGRCALKVAVSDGRGGTAAGTLRVCVGPSTTARFPPEVVETFKSLASTPAEGGTVVFRVRAKDPQGSALTFDWAANTGTLGTATHDATTSERVWTAPACVSQTTPLSVTVSVTNALGLSTSASFSLTGGTPCVETPVLVLRLAAGWYHSVAARHDAGAWGWGDNALGQLGDGTTVNPSAPVQAQGVTGVTALSAGAVHTVALKQDGTVWGWGHNVYGQVGDGTTFPRAEPVRVLDVTDITALATGGHHTLALARDGTVWAWGYNGYGQLGNGTDAERSRAARVPGLADVRAIAAGTNFSLALKQDGTVWAWGDNTFGQLGDGTAVHRWTPVRVQELTGVTALAAGIYHTLALKQDGTVWAWGFNVFGQLGDGTTANRLLPVQVEGLTAVTTLAAAGHHSLALKQDGGAWAWGDNSQGQLGDGTGTARQAPVPVQGLTDVGGLAAGLLHSLAWTRDGAVWAWGDNSHGQLGDGTTLRALAPVTVQSLSP